MQCYGNRDGNSSAPQERSTGLLLWSGGAGEGLM